MGGGLAGKGVQRFIQGLGQKGKKEGNQRAKKGFWPGKNFSEGKEKVG